jgi:glycine oxidase
VFQPDVLVVGGGLIGLTCATAVAREGLRVLVASSSERGAASPASAGILAPTVGAITARGRALGIAARNLYPGYVEGLASRTGLHVTLDRSGVLEVEFDEAGAATLRANLTTGSAWIDATELSKLVPLLAPAAGAALQSHDGAVDATTLLAAVRADVERDPRISLTDGRVVRIDAARRPIVAELEAGGCVQADVLVLAAGAWIGSIRGLPRPLPVVPVRGQILELEGPTLGRVVMGPRGYAVPRSNRSLVGSTMEQVGFDPRATPEGAALIRALAAELSPSLASRAAVGHWAGLRPVTPDFLPIVGADPDCAGLLYACGHSKNGVLLAPLTAQVIAQLVTHGSSSIDVSPYAPARFGEPDR